MKRFLQLLAISVLTFLATVAFPAHADWVARQGESSVRLYEKPRTNEAVLKLIPPQFRTRFQAAVGLIAGARYEACWTKDPNGAYLVYEDGDQGMVPAGDLKRPIDL
jgi:hypothetical protein